MYGKHGKTFSATSHQELSAYTSWDTVQATNWNVILYCCV